MGESVGSDQPKRPPAVAGHPITLDEIRIKELIREVLNERSSVDEETHKQHHLMWENFGREITLYFEERRKAREFWDGVKNTAVGTVVVTVIGGIFAALAWIGSLVLQAMHTDPTVLHK